MQTQTIDLTRRAASRGARVLAVAGVLLGTTALAGLSASAAEAAPAFSVSTAMTPTEFRVGDQGDGWAITPRNVGDAATTADPVTLTVVLPEGITARRMSGNGWTCTVASVTCTRTTPVAVNADAPVTLRVAVGEAAAAASPATISVAGGGTAGVTVNETIPIEPYRPFGVNGFEAGAYDDAGEDYTQAGGHPFEASARFQFNRNTDAAGAYTPVEDVRRLVTELPVGFIGNPQVAPTCTETEMVERKCPAESQVGIVDVDLRTKDIGAPGRASVYNIEPQPGHAAQFGFSLATTGTVYLFASVRSDSDYGVTITVPTTPSQPKIQGIDLSLWGVPADPTHTPDRQCPGFRHPSDGVGVPSCASTAPLTPFLTNQSECRAESPVTTLRIDSWQNPGVLKSFTDEVPPIVGCDKLTFEPSVDVAPSTKAPDAPTGLNVDLAFPQDDNADGLAPPPLKKATVTLPEGMTINPAGAGGLEACADQDLKLQSKDPVTCPNSAKVGTVTAKSPLLEEELTGGVFIRSQNSDDPESGEMFRIALVLENEERGISIRLPGSIRANKDTGRLETTFDNNPQLPVSDLHLQFKDGPRAPLASPPTCGDKTVETTLTSWGGQTVNRKTGFTVDCVPSLGGFSPSFGAGVVNPIAGASSPFTLKVAKPDGNADLNGLRLELPEGLLATIKGNLGTRVGTATVGAGPGSSPYWLPGSVVLEGPYGDAPYSLRVTVPAKAGPFDLGDVVVRQKIYVDPHDAHVTIVSDPLPTIVKGVPVRLQNLNVAVDKPGFMRNPTSCAEKTISGTLGSAAGQTAAVSSRFQVGGCEKLPLKPKLTLAMTDKNATTQNKTTPFTATVTQTSDEAALKKVVVTMPPTLSLLADNAQALCKPAEAAAKNCPKGSIVGKASATTPLLDEPLTGDVFFVEGTRVTASGKVTSSLPKLWVALRGPIALDLWADTDVTNDRLVNTFGFVPDAPISTFKLDIFGGKNGILAVAQKDGKANVCTGEQVADAVFDGQNGKQVRQRTRVSTPCGFGVLSQRLYSTKVKVRVGGLGAGKLTISGNGIKKTTRTIKSATVGTVTAKLSASGKRSYAGRKALKLRATFTPAAKGAKAQSRSVTVKRAAAKKAKKASSKK